MMEHERQKEADRKQFLKLRKRAMHELFDQAAEERKKEREAKEKHSEDQKRRKEVRDLELQHYFDKEREI